MNVRWSERALAEFADTAAYVAREFGRQAAQKMRDNINEAIASIAQFPHIGKVSFSDEETAVEFHELALTLSSIIYAIYEEEIFIVSIWSNRQDRTRLYAELNEQPIQTIKQ